MKTELFISWRYLRTRRKEKFISLISVISVLGIAIGVATLIVVIGVMSGFDKDLRDKIIGNYAHITISSYRGIDDAGYENILKAVKSQPHVTGVSPYLQGQLLVKEQEKLFAVGIKGIDPQTASSVMKINKYITAGSIGALDKDCVIIGKELASYLGLGINSYLTTYFLPGKERRLKVVGIFQSGMYDYDLNLIFTDLATAREILGFSGKLSAVSVKLDNLYLADKVRGSLQDILGLDYVLKTWTEANQNFFAALRLEKITMFIILTLIILVASFNIVSTLVVLVVEKTKDIGILKAMGMHTADIRRIFTYEGLIIGLLGIFFGAGGGFSLCGLLKRYQFIKLPQDIYYIDKLPVAIQLWPDVILIILAAVVITLVSTIYPANKASRMSPVEALRYE